MGAPFRMMSVPHYSMAKWTSIEKIKNIEAKKVLRKQNELNVYIGKKAKEKKTKKKNEIKEKKSEILTFSIKGKRLFWSWLIRQTNQIWQVKHIQDFYEVNHFWVWITLLKNSS